MMAAIRFDGVRFAYGGVPAVEDATFTVPEGAFVALLGPNGGGKTTLARLILGLLKPDRGRVQVFGEAPGSRAGRIGYVPQATTVTPAFPITALDLVALGGAGRSGPRSWLGPRIDRATRRASLDALAAVEMEAFAERPFATLSGGQRQRLLIARALAADPDLLVLDEPTANIDPAGKTCVIELLDKLVERRTLVLISHDLTAVVPRVSAVACVNRRLIYNPKPVLTPEMLHLIYGVHAADCPMETFIHDLSHVLPVMTRPHRHPDPVRA